MLSIITNAFVVKSWASYADWLDNYPTIPHAERYTMATPSSDGIPNLFKFALDIDPQQPGQTEMPHPVLQDTSEGSYLTFDVPLNETAVSSKLLGWRTTHLNETFSDGEHTRQDLPASATWFSSRAQSTLTSDSSGMTQQLQDAAGQVTTYFTAPGEVISLEIGETLRLSFNITLLGTDYDNTAYLRFGLFNTSMNSRLNGHNEGLSNAHFNNATGYAMMLADITEGSTVHIRYYTGSPSGELLSNYKTSTEHQPTDKLFSTWAAETTYTVVFELTRTSEDQMQLYTRLTSADNQVLYTLLIRDSVANNYEFDTFTLMSHKFNGAGFHLSDVQVCQDSNSGMMLFPETSKTLEADSWQPVASMHMNRLSASHTSTDLPTEDEAKCFIRLRADSIESLEQPRFVDRSTDLGLPSVGGRVAWIDFNNDEWTDLIAGGRIFINNQGTSFTQIKSGLGSTVAADFNNDGWNDLYSITKQTLYKNDGGTGVVEVALPEFPTVYSSEAATWGDFNNDGYLDLYVSGYEDWDNQITYPDFLLLNLGDESFQKSQISGTNRARGTTTSDFDQDGDLDIYVSNYRLQQNFLWKNDGNANFTNASGTYNTAATSTGYAGGHSIGAAWGDFNNSGYFDLFAGNFAHAGQPVSRFLRNTGPTGNFHFEDMGPQGVYFQESYASPTAADFNNDGKLDLMFTTVYGIASYSIPNFPALFMNQGDFVFNDVTESSGLDNLAATYQAAWADYNNDGFMDLFIAGSLFENQGNNYNWLKVKLRGDGSEINRSAIGAQVRIQLGEETLSRQVETGTGTGNQNDLILHFGLGQHEGPFDLEIFWPDGSQSTQEVDDSNQLIVIDYPE
ncbi:CRTAC1 family protein [Coraliomargarita sp. W4R53]